MSVCVCAKSLQSCRTLCDPIDGSPSGSAILGILQARILEWVAISLSNAWKWKVKVKVKSLSPVRFFPTAWTAAYQGPPSMGFSRQGCWSGLPLPSPMGESEKGKWSCSVVSDSPRPHGLQPTRLLRHGILQERVLEWGAIAFSCEVPRGVKLTDIESRMCLPGAVRKEKWRAII